MREQRAAVDERKEGMMGQLVKLSDGRAADVVKIWRETSRWNGRNDVGRYTGEEFRSADLGLSKSGAWILIHESSFQGEAPWAEEISPSEAAGWFAACNIDLPEELEEYVV